MMRKKKVRKWNRHKKERETERERESDKKYYKHFLNFMKA